jgi:quercetin dioxygenase-like cupin family protein
MNTIHISQQDMQQRIARFRELAPLPIQFDKSIPQAALDMIYSRKLLSVVGLEQATGAALGVGAPIRGAAGITMTLAVCPPGQGPSLHAHRKTFETFTVLRGKFEIRWNDDAGCSAVLEEFDTISVPPGVCRAFCNVGDSEGILQVIISGGVHDMQDIEISTRVAAAIQALGPGLLEKFQATGLSFKAGDVRE